MAAAAEQAGFRACLRCRPYRTEPSISWAGPELVCRAVQLVLDGGLDGYLEHDLGARLGVSARHLRRLFWDQLGVTPDQLARSRRTHFARRLLDDTDFTVAEIAFASGFGSVRQLNRACREVFRGAPLELRARRRSGDVLAAEGGIALRLSFRPPLAWVAMLDYFRARAVAGVESVTDCTYRRTVVVGGDPGMLELTPGGPDYLVLRAQLPHWDGLIHLVQRARRIFNLDADLEAATRHLVSDPLVDPMIRDCPGVRPPGAWDPFEIGVRAIVAQYLGMTGTNNAMARIAAEHGSEVVGLESFGLTCVFPSPPILAAADLSTIGLASSCTASITSFARAVAEASLSLDRGSSLDELVNSVVRQTGITSGAAQYLAMRLGEPDAFSLTDADLRSSPPNRPRNPASAGRIEEPADGWRPWRAYAVAHLVMNTPVVS